MSIDMKHPDYVDLKYRIRENPKEFVAIVGAGLSRPCGLPSWTELRDCLVSNARERTTDRPKEEKSGYVAQLKRISQNPRLWECFAEIQDMLSRQAYEQCIKDKLTLKDKKSIPASYALLWQLDIKGIITYNIDTCAIDSYSRVYGHAADTATGREVAKFPQFLVGPQQFVFQPHGHVSDPSTWVFTHSERSELLARRAYTDFMKSLCQTKQLVILGFDTEDFAFKYLLESALGERSTIGTRHYILLPRTDPGLVNTYGDQGFAVIPYSPSDDLSHPEVEATLKDILAFRPDDDIPPSVFTGGTTDPSRLPSDDELVQMPIDEARTLLNKAVASIIPPDTTPHSDDIDKLEKFYKDHLRAIHMSWLIQPVPGCDVVHGYRVVDIKGRGAFGQVYEAEKIGSDERVAVKVLLPEVRGNREYLSSFRRGVRSMRILTRRDVGKMVKFIDAFEVPACVLMEFIDGPTLTEAKNRRLLDGLSECLDVLVQIGEVVHSAHNLDERVLHRDLKPDNVILRDCYNKGDALDVVVLDFDLSWHKGASELSVVEGARAQGYAAPEQTATGMKRGVTTRHTGVDVFGYGMLAFFVFVGENPRPNEQNFAGFQERIRDVLRQRFRSNWRCLPAFLSRTIVQCTCDEQAARMPFASAVEAFREAHKMAYGDSLLAGNPLVLQEIAAIVEPEGRVETNDFGRHVRIRGLDASRQIYLKLESEGDKIVVAIQLEKVRSEGEHRNVAKFLDNARNKAVSKLKAQPLNDARGMIGQSRLIVSARWFLKSSVTRSSIEKVGEMLIAARNSMVLGQ